MFNIKIFSGPTVASRRFVIIWLYAVTLLWYRMAASELPLIVASLLFTLLLVSLLVGDLFLKYALRDIEKFNNLPTKLLSGLLCLNVFLFIACFALPFCLATDWIILSILVLIIWCYARRGSFSNLLPSSHLSEIIFILVIPLTITVWCHELLQPLMFKGGKAIIQAWPDVYYHLCQISAFASSKGLGAISDVQMAHSIVHPYHLASYMLPAVLVNITGGTSLVAYAALLVPFGILMTSLAAYSLGNIMFGKWPALAASLALILLPDAYQQGFGNPYLGYHWLEQVAPAQGYGVASAAFAFMLILEACRTAQYRLVFLGYVFVFFTLLYKAHIFVAISFLALVFPVIFMKGRMAKYRTLLLLLLTCLYLGVAALSQIIPIVPTLRMDGSGLSGYSSLILQLQDDGLAKHTFTWLFTKAGHHGYLRALAFSLMLITCTFGVFSILYAVLFKYLKHRIQPATRLFPLMVVSIYLIMAISLALDEHHIGTPDELLHRPFVWAWFVLVVWCAGASYFHLFNDALPANKVTKWALLLLIIFLEIIPLHYSKGIQTAIGYAGTQTLPLCQVEAAGFIRTHSLADEVVQDSRNDSHLILSSLSERKPFAMDSGGVRAPAGIQIRLALLQQLKELENGNEAASFMKEHGITWYVTHRRDNIPWTVGRATVNTRDHVAFKCGDYRVYHFPDD